MPPKGAFTSVRPKREAEQFARDQYADSEGHASKKQVRFDPRNPSTLATAVEEDPVLDLDEIGRSRQVKRGAVNIDGFESDSSNDNFDTRANEKAKAAAAGADEEDDDDMFAEPESRPGDPSMDHTKKNVRFLEDQEIEGQEADSKSGGHVSVNFRTGTGHPGTDSDSSDDSADDEERDRITFGMDPEVGAGGKKKHAPKLDAFNMKSELEDGRFDENGNYVRYAADPNAIHDEWLTGITKKDIKKAKEAHEKQQAEQRARDMAEAGIESADLLASIISKLSPGENIWEAFVRLDKTKLKKPTKHTSRHGKQAAMDIDPPTEEQLKAEAQRVETIEALTEAANMLTERGYGTVYEDPRERIIFYYNEFGGKDWVDPPSTAEPAQWEFRYAAYPDTVNGPYPEEQMKAWKEEGHLQDGVEFRKVGDDDDEWTRLPDF